MIMIVAAVPTMIISVVGHAELGDDKVNVVVCISFSGHGFCRNLNCVITWSNSGCVPCKVQIFSSSSCQVS